MTRIERALAQIHRAFVAVLDGESERVTALGAEPVLGRCRHVVDGPEPAVPVAQHTYSRGVPTFTATGDPGDDEPNQTEEQRAALVRAISTPALTESLERFNSQFARMAQQVVGSQFRSIAEQVNGTIGQAFASQLAPVLKASRIQTSIGESLRPLIEQQLNTRKLMEPFFAQIAERQHEWAKALIGPLSAHADLQARMAGMLVTPEFTAALERINEVSRVRLELPDADALDRLSGLIDSGEIDEETLETARSGLDADAAMAAAIDNAADVLARERPWLSRERCRQLVVFWAWLMWAAGLVVVAVAAPPIIDTMAAAAGVSGSRDVAKRAGQEFDRRFPPKDEPEKPVHH